MATFKMGTKNVVSQSGTAEPAIASNVNIKDAFSALDSSATNGPTSGTAVTKNTTLPIFACRAWANFDAGTVDGSNDCTINASANITRINRYATGKYKVYFATDFPDTNYVACGAFYNRILSPNHSDITASIFDFYLLYSGSASNGGNSSSIAFFR